MKTTASANTNAPAETKPKRTQDSFQLARGIYLARKRLFAKANQLIAEAPVDVASLVEAHEDADSRQTIAEVPSSADGSSPG